MIYLADPGVEDDLLHAHIGAQSQLFLLFQQFLKEIFDLA